MIVKGLKIQKITEVHTVSVRLWHPAKSTIKALTEVCKCNHPPFNDMANDMADIPVYLNYTGPKNLGFE